MNLLQTEFYRNGKFYFYRFTVFSTSSNFYGGAGGGGFGFSFSFRKVLIISVSV
jgi:hypothetical protein